MYIYFAGELLFEDFYERKCVVMFLFQEKKLLSLSIRVFKNDHVSNFTFSGKGSKIQIAIGR